MRDRTTPYLSLVNVGVNLISRNQSIAQLKFYSSVEVNLILVFFFFFLLFIFEIISSYFHFICDKWKIKEMYFLKN